MRRAVRWFGDVPYGWNRPSPPSVDGQATLKDAETARYVKRRMAGEDPRRLRGELQQLVAAGSEVGVVTYNAALRLAARRKSDRVLKRLHADMKNRGVAADAETFRIIIGTLLRVGQQALAGAMLAEMQAQGFTDAAPLAAHAMWVTHTQDVQERRAVVDAAVVWWRAQGRGEAARTAVGDLLNLAVMHSVTWHEAFGYLGLRQDVLGDVDAAAGTLHLLTHLIALCGREGCTAAAGELFEALTTGGMTPDTAAYTALLKAYSVAGDAATAARILKEMARQDAPPNEHSFTSFLTSVAADVRLPRGDKVAVGEAVHAHAAAQGHTGIRLDTGLARVYASARDGRGAARHRRAVAERYGKVPAAMDVYLSGATRGVPLRAAPQRLSFEGALSRAVACGLPDASCSASPAAASA